jgi:dienelactone hydrolase
MDTFRDLVLPDDSPKDWKRRRIQIQKRVFAYFGKSPKKSCSLSPKIGAAKKEAGYTRLHVTYQSEPGSKVTAYLFIPHKLSKPAPVVLCYHGTSAMGKELLGGSIENRAYAIELAQRGYVTFVPDQWSAGERAGIDEKPFETIKFYKKNPDWSLEGKIVWDHMRAMEFLKTVPEADMKRVGAMGHSRGGRATLYHMLFDERVKTGIVSCGVPPYRGDPRLAKHFNKKSFIDFPKAHEEMGNGKYPNFDKHEMLALVAPRPLLLITPFLDHNCPHGYLLSEIQEKVAAVYRFLGVGNNFSRYVHGEGHTTGPILRAAVYAWLDYHLKGEIEGLPGNNFAKNAPGVKKAKKRGSSAG